MKSHELREKYLKFFESKGHTIVPSDSLIPENDPTTLFTSSGMQPIVPYLLGEKHPMGTRIVDSQKCFRAVDIEGVGDNRHTTMFEMLGNWSFGDYFKKEQIAWIFEFLTKDIGLNPKDLYVTVFRGDEVLKIPRDDETVNIWQELFRSANIDAEVIDFAEKNGLQSGRIFYYDVKKNWWSRSGAPINMPLGEPGGPDSEMFWDFGAELKLHENSEFKDRPCHVNCDCGRFLEIGNNVFMQYVKTNKGFEPLPKGNIDFGGGLERILAAKNGDPDIFKTDLFAPIINKIEEMSGKKYGESDSTYGMRVIIDHLKAATFIMGDNKGISPANTDRGYIIRRLIRRAIRYGKKIGIKKIDWTVELAKEVVNIYRNIYPELDKNKDFIFDNLIREEEKFEKTLNGGIERIEKLLNNYTGDTKEFFLDANTLFNLYQTYGFPIELSIEEMNKIRAEKGGRHISKNIELNILTSFQNELKKHQNLSRTISAGKFKGGLIDSNTETKRLHTAAHLLLVALREVLGDHVLQKGSNITAERLRFDFSHSEKMTPEQLRRVEYIVNEQIRKALPITCEEMSLRDAENSGAMGVFKSKYGDRVKTYKIGNFSHEICGGPHAKNTSELGEFTIQKEESSSVGTRRIRANLKRK